MTISIKFIDTKSKKRNGVYILKGKIAIDNHIEYFDSSLDWWSREDYEHQWKKGIERLIESNYSCLVTSVDDPRIHPWIEWYVMIKSNDQLHIRPQAIFGQNYQEKIGIKEFTPDTCFDFIRDYHFEVCANIDEWIIPFK